MKYAEEDIMGVKEKLEAINKKIEVLRKEQNEIDTSTDYAINSLSKRESELKQL